VKIAAGCSGEPGDGLSEFMGIFRLDANSRLRFFHDYSGLTFHSQDDRTGTGHEFKHFGRNDCLEDIGFLQQNKACVRGGNVSRNFFARLLSNKADIA